MKLKLSVNFYLTVMETKVLMLQNIELIRLAKTFDLAYNCNLAYRFRNLYPRNSVRAKRTIKY